MKYIKSVYILIFSIVISSTIGIAQPVEEKIQPKDYLSLSLERNDWKQTIAQDSIKEIEISNTTVAIRFADNGTEYTLLTSREKYCSSVMC